MNSTGIAAFPSLWRQLVIGDLDIQQLSRDVLLDCGVDASGLAASDIEAIFSPSEDTRWKEIAWAFDEALASYLATDLDCHQFGRAVFVVCVLVDAIRRGHGSACFSFDKMISLICKNMESADVDFRIEYTKVIASCV